MAFPDKLDDVEAKVQALTQLLCSEEFNFEDEEHDIKRILEKLNTDIQELKQPHWIGLHLPTKEFPGLKHLIQERIRQVEEEGWDAEHDEQHSPAVLARAAATYLLPDKYRGNTVLDVSIWKWIWPFENKWWKPKDEFQDLLRGAALALAALDRKLKDQSDLPEDYNGMGDEQ